MDMECPIHDFALHLHLCILCPLWLINMLTVEEALTLVAQNVAPLAPRRVPLGEAAGLVLAEDITSDVNSPPYDKALMDGYAVRSGDRQPERQILEEIAAGAVPRFPVTPGTASRIMTGAPIPEGADAVVPIEQTELVDDATVRLQQVDPPPGQNVLPLGASMRAGDVGASRRRVAAARSKLRFWPKLAAAMVTAIPRPRVAVLPTGNELVPVGEKPGAGQIRNSNGPLLAAAADACRGRGHRTRHRARRPRRACAAGSSKGLAADVLVLSGGVSAGKFDLVPGVLAELGVEQVFHKSRCGRASRCGSASSDDGDGKCSCSACPAIR